MGRCPLAQPSSEVAAICSFGGQSDPTRTLRSPERTPMSAVLQPSVAADRKAFYERIDKASVTPLWEVLHGLITPTPNTPCKPHLWKWDQMWPWIQEAGKLITAKEAERRVLVLENPGMRGRSSTTPSRSAGRQRI